MKFSSQYFNLNSGATKTISGTNEVCLDGNWRKIGSDDDLHSMKEPEQGKWRWMNSSQMSLRTSWSWTNVLIICVVLAQIFVSYFIVYFLPR